LATKLQTHDAGHTHSGLWIPVLFFIAAPIIAVQLSSAPSSGYKKAMVAFAILTPITLVIYIIAMVAYAVDGAPHYRYYGLVAYNPYNPYAIYAANLSVISGVVLSFYALFGSLFIMFADITFRSAKGPLDSSLSSPLYLRGVNLGLNLAGMFLLMPLFSFVGIPLTLHQLRKIRQHNSGMFVSSYVFGILSFVSLAAIVLLLIIAGSLPGYNYYNDYNDYNYYCKRSILQDDTTTTTTFFGNETTTLFGNETTSTSGASAATGGGWLTPTSGASVATGGGWVPATTVPTDETTSWIGWATEPSEFWPKPTACAQVYRDPYYYNYPTNNSALQSDVGAIIALIVLSVFQWIFNFVFIGVSDALILKAIGESAGGSGTVGRVVQAGVVLVHPCASCAAPLQFQRTGPATQVQCYKCSAVCEFQTA
jgi:hypothetical protein